MNDTLEEIVAYEMQVIEKSYLSSEEENINYTESVDEWIEKIKHIEGEKSLNNELPHETLFFEDCGMLNYDYEVVNKASGYITNAAFKYKGTLNKCITSKCFKTLQEMRDWLTGKNYFLYVIVSYARTYRIVENSFKTYTLDEPEMRYIFKGYIL
jgi:hypothetical protein